MHLIKLIILTAILIVIALFAVFGKGVKEALVRKIYLQNPNYNCSEGSLCTTCVISGETCRCDSSQCRCKDKIVPKETCMLLK